MIIDSSAITAVLLKEDGHERLLDRIADATSLSVGAPTVVETGMVLVSRMGVLGRTLLSRFLQEAGVEVVACTEEHWSVAVDAFEEYGKGRSPAGLNFGDCLTYAIAAVAGEPLLCLGDDFVRTDLQLVEAG